MIGREPSLHWQAYKEGARARLAGKSLDDNPYDRESIKGESWSSGWRSA